jgi:transcription antitermination factor NusG
MQTAELAVQPSRQIFEGPWREFASAHEEARWYAIYTCARREKRVAEQLEQRRIECFLPAYESVRRWKDRRKCIRLPLFPSYVFVRLALSNRLRVLEVPGVVRFVGFNEIATPLEDEEMQRLLDCSRSGVRLQPHPYLAAGRRVRVQNGPLCGMEGILLRRKGALRLVISIDLIQRSLIADVDVMDVAPA